jgi:excisionase family DNA binding protein
LGRKTVYQFIAANALPAWKVGRHLYRIAVADVLRFEIALRDPKQAHGTWPSAGVAKSPSNRLTRQRASQ